MWSQYLNITDRWTDRQLAMAVPCSYQHTGALEAWKATELQSVIGGVFIANAIIEKTLVKLLYSTDIHCLL